MARRKPRPQKNEMYKKPPFRAEKIGDKPDRVSWEDVMAKMKQIQEEHQIPIFAASLKGAATLWSGACVDDFNAGAYLNDDIRNLRDWRDVEKAGGAIIMNNAPYNGVELHIMWTFLCFEMSLVNTLKVRLRYNLSNPTLYH